jgi:cell division transport system permease protein
MSAIAERRYAAVRAAALIRDQPGSFLLNVALAALALVVPLFLGALVNASAPLAARLQAGPELNVFVTPGTPSGDVENLQTRLAATAGVVGVRLIPRDQAFAELIRRAGLPAATSTRANPLPDVLVARFGGTVEADAIEQSAAAIRGWARVDSVRLDLEWYRRAAAIAKAAGLVLAIVAGLSLALIALALVAAARGQAVSRQAESSVLLLAGARPSFIVRPYAYAGAITLGLGAALAMGAATAALALVEPRVAAVAAAYGQPFRLETPPLWVPAVLLLGVAAGGFVAAAVGARAALARTRIL